MARFEARYGEVTEIYASSDTTMRSWREVEPGNTSGIEAQPSDTDTPIHAVFVNGDFSATGPPPEESPGMPMSSTYDEGRIVFNDSGDLLSVSLWSAAEAVPPKSTGDPAFGADFDDN